MSLVAPGTEGFSLEKPPEYFKDCKILFHDEENKTVALEMPDWPVVINADGCSTNISAGDKLSKLFGLLTPTIQCVTHTDGSLKRLANSKIMSVQEVTDFAQNFRKVMKHFQNSAKSTFLINDTLAVLSMKKVHLMTFCPTRMSHLLDSCLKAVELFIPLCDDNWHQERGN